MKLAIGLILVPACVLGGYLLHHGQLVLLYVPTEYLIIVGCLVGSMIIKNPGRVLKAIVSAVPRLFGGGGPDRKQYVGLLQMLYELLALARKESPLALEAHADDPKGSSILSKYPGFLSRSHAVAFLSDSLKLLVEGKLPAHHMDELMERDLEIIHHEEMAPSEALSSAADSLPAIGIVAAVLGIILTMSAIDEGAAVVGEKVAGALVGTFLGVFLAYGFVAPVSGALAAAAEALDRYHQCIRHVLVASISGMDPATAVEIGRRNIAPADRPSFKELEEAIREVKG